MKRAMSALVLASLLLLVVTGQVIAQGCIQQFAFVADAAIPDDSPMQPGQQFAKAWRLTNNGTCDWTSTFSVAYVGGTQLSDLAAAPLGGPVLIGQTVDLYVPMTAPTKPGTYSSYWQLRDENAKPFGNTLFVRIIVPESKPRTRALVKATATVPSTGVGRHESPPARAAGNEWTWQHPLPQGNVLSGVWGSSGSDVFAVGFKGIILHYDGSAWSAMSGDPTQDLQGVWGSSGSDVFAVGSKDTFGRPGTILHYDGSAWSAMSSGTKTVLMSVWGSSGSDVFAVGIGDDVILHFDGKTWSAMSSGTKTRLVRVWGSSGSDVFAVGPNSALGFSKGFILHYDGSTWSVMSSGATVVGLNGVWGSSASDVFVVGDTFASIGTLRRVP